MRCTACQRSVLILSRRSSGNGSSSHVRYVTTAAQANSSTLSSETSMHKPMKKNHMQRIAIQRRRSAVPSLPLTSNSELNTILSTLRTRHILPSILNSASQALIHRSSYRDDLIANPPKISISNESFTLEPLDKTALLPQRKQLIKRAIELLPSSRAIASSSTSSDATSSSLGINDASIENESTSTLTTASQSTPNLLSPFLSSLSAMRFPVSSDTIAKLLRTTIESSQREKNSPSGMGSVVQALRGVRSTSLTLQDKSVFKEVIRGLRTVAESRRKDSVRGWSKAQINKAIRCSDEVSKLMCDERHSSTGSKNKDERMGDKFVIGHWLELRAVRAKKYPSKDETELKQYFSRLVLSFNKDVQLVFESDELDNRNALGNVFYAKMAFWQGVTLADKLIKDHDLPKQKLDKVREFAKECGDEVTRTVQELPKTEHDEKSNAGRAIREYNLAKKNIGVAE